MRKTDFFSSRSFAGRIYLLISSPPAARGFSAAAEISQNHHDQMRDKPNVVRAHILKNVNQNQNSRRENSQKNIRPLRHIVLRKLRREQKQINEQNDAREK